MVKESSNGHTIDPKKKKKKENTKESKWFAWLKKYMKEDGLMKTDDDFVKSRRLSKAWCTPIYLISTGVGTVICGEYTGWNAGLQSGIGTLAMATLIANVLYLLLSLVLAEMASALPFSGASFTFTTAAFGSLVGCMSGFFYIMMLMLMGTQDANTVAVFFVNIFSLGSGWTIPFVILVLLAACLVCLNLKGVMRSLLVLNSIAIAVIILYSFIVSPKLGHGQIIDLSVNKGAFESGFVGVLKMIPWGIWFFIGFEMLPCCSEETVNPRENIPKSIMWSFGWLSLLAWLVIIFCCAIPPGVQFFKTSTNPFFDGLVQNYMFSPNGPLGIFIQVILINGTFVSVIGCLFGAQRFIYSLSRAGFLPFSLSLCFEEGIFQGAPYYANLTTFFMALILEFILFFSDNSGSTMIYAVDLYGLMSYLLDFGSYIRLYYKLPTLRRPFNNPFGITGAVIGIIISLVSIVFIVQSNEAALALMIVAVQGALTVPYFIFFLRKRLTLSPERAFIAEQVKELYKNDVVRYSQDVLSSSKKSGRDMAIVIK